MNFYALTVGIGIGLLHWLTFFFSINKLFSNKENLPKRGIATIVAFLRLVVTIGLGALSILKLELPATMVAIGVLVGFNAGRIPFLAKGVRASRRSR